MLSRSRQVCCLLALTVLLASPALAQLPPDLQLPERPDSLLAPEPPAQADDFAAVPVTPVTPVIPPEPPWPNQSPYNWVAPTDPDLALTVTADLLSVSGDTHFWYATAVDSMTGDLVVELSVTLTYGPALTVWDTTVERFPNRWGFFTIPQSQNTDQLETQYSDDGTIDYAEAGDITWLLVFVGANSLDPYQAAGEFAAEGEGWTSNGCNWPCSQKWKACCDVHDACYCKGGNGADRKKCDKDFRQCLKDAGMGGFGAWVYYTGVRLFGWVFFEYKDKDVSVTATTPHQPLEP